MPIRVNCPGCQRKLKIADKLAGRRLRCPACQAVVEVPGVPSDPSDTATNTLAVTSAVPRAAPQGAEGESAPVDEDAEAYRLLSQADQSEESPPTARVLPARTVGKKPRPGSELDFGRRTIGSGRLPQEESSGGWRDHLVWILLVALIPLGLSVAFPEPPFVKRLEETVREHPEIVERVNSAESDDAFFDALPEHRLAGAHLPRDTNLHWGYALIAGAVFLSVLSAMSVESEAGPLRLIWTGVLTGTIGIFLLLAFQWIAAFSLGMGIRGRGVAIVVLLLIKLIGYSYRAALDPDNGLILSFLGFTGGVGLCEELCKALPVMFFLRGSTNVGWRAACLVGMASGIGFGISEGITYSSDYYNGISPFLTYLVRFASCVALHATWAAAVAILMRENQDYLFHDGFDWGDAAYFVLNYLLIAMVLHGLYDTLLKRDHDVWALAIAGVSFAWLAWLVSRRRQEDAE